MKRIPGINGALAVRITGAEQVRFLNLCTRHGIAFCGLRKEADAMSGTVSLSGFRLMFQLRHKADVHIRVTKRSGIYFLIRRNRTRKAAYLAAAAAFAGLYLMSLFIWDIAFEGNVRYTDSFLRRFVSEEGCQPGMRVSSIVCSELEKKIRNEMDGIVWVSARVDGTRLVIRIRENTDNAAKQEDVQPRSLYASRSGVIERMVTRSGVPAAAEGEEVSEGQLLVSGLVPVSDDNGETARMEEVAADADVFIRYGSWFECRISRKQTETVCVGQKTRYGLLLPGMELFLSYGFPADAELVTEEVPIRLFGSLYLPGAVEKKTARILQKEEVMRSDSEMTAQAEARFLDYLENLDDLGVEIIENNVTIDVHEDFCLMKGTLLLEQNAVKAAPVESS